MSARQTIPIDSGHGNTGESLEFNLSASGEYVLGVYVVGDGSATYEIDVSDENGNYLEAVETITGSTATYGGFEAADWVRVKVADGGGTGTSGDEADVLLTASGG